EWTAGIDAMGLSEERRKSLEELLEYAILQRFKTLTLEEIRKMIQLSPLEESVAVQELIQQGKEKGKEEGREEGLEKGQLIGQIQLIQRLLKRPQTPKESLRLLGTEELETMLANLETELALERNDA
ncbi:MAG: hypothetical protein ACLFN9_14150, partial [Desulfococcaceae bacterium]